MDSEASESKDTALEIAHHLNVVPSDRAIEDQNQSVGTAIEIAGKACTVGNMSRRAAVRGEVRAAVAVASTH